MGAWRLGSTESSSPMAEPRLSGNDKIFLQYFQNFYKEIMIVDNRYHEADHGYTAEVTYEGEARPYVAPPKPAYSAALI